MAHPKTRLFSAVVLLGAALTGSCRGCDSLGLPEKAALARARADLAPAVDLAASDLAASDLSASDASDLAADDMEELPDCAFQVHVPCGDMICCYPLIL